MHQLDTLVTLADSCCHVTVNYKYQHLILYLCLLVYFIGVFRGGEGVRGAAAEQGRTCAFMTSFMIS